MEENQVHKRRVRYKGTHPRKFEEKYKERDPEKYADTIEKVISKGSTPAGMHISIMVKEILDFLQIQPGQVGMDATLGYGGHSMEMMKCLKGNGHLHSLDVDPIEIVKTKERLASKGFGPEIFTAHQMNFRDIDKLTEEVGLFDFASVCISAFLLFDINETFDEEQDFILRPDVLPHIRDIHAELIVGIAFTKVLADIERIKEGIRTFQLRGEIHFVQVHCKGGKNANPALEKAGGRITLVLILLDSILIALTRGVTLQFHGEDRQAVQENHEVNALIGLVIYLLHYREDVFLAEHYALAGACRS